MYCLSYNIGRDRPLFHVHMDRWRSLDATVLCGRHKRSIGMTVIMLYGRFFPSTVIIVLNEQYLGLILKPFDPA